MFTLTINRIFIRELQNLQGKWLWAQFGSANHLVLFVFLHIIYEVGAERKMSVLDLLTLCCVWRLWTGVIQLRDMFNIRVLSAPI